MVNNNFIYLITNYNFKDKSVKYSVKIIILRELVEHSIDASGKAIMPTLRSVVCSGEIG